MSSTKEGLAKLDPAEVVTAFYMSLLEQYQKEYVESDARKSMGTLMKMMGTELPEYLDQPLDAELATRFASNLRTVVAGSLAHNGAATIGFSGDIPTGLLGDAILLTSHNLMGERLRFPRNAFMLVTADRISVMSEKSEWKVVQMWPEMQELTELVQKSGYEYTEEQKAQLSQLGVSF
jgi:hypothetical protein